MKKRSIILAIVCLVIIDLMLVGYIVVSSINTQNKYIQLYYETEAATLVSPHSLREKIEHGENNFIVVDTRDKEDYEREHIIGAVNIPGYSDEKKLVASYKALIKKYPNKDVLIYCYTEVCMRGRKVGRILARNNIFVQELGIGFNEWKNYWKKWNYENEWDSLDIETLIERGTSSFTDAPSEGGFCSVEENISC